MKITYTKEILLAAIWLQPCSATDTARAATNPKDILRMLRELKKEGLIKDVRWKQTNWWVAFDWVRPPANLPHRMPSLLPIIKQGPVTEAALIAEVGRGMNAVRKALRRLRARGKIRTLMIQGVPHQVTKEYEPAAALVLAQIEHRSAEEGDCRVWQDACDRQGHPVMRYQGTIMRVDIVAWKLAGRTIPKGSTLIPTRDCGCKGCIDIEHKKTAPRSTAMKLAFKEKPATRGRCKAAADRARESRGRFTLDDVAYIRASEKNNVELAKEFGVGKSLVQGVRSGRTYKDYSTSPFAGLGARP